MMDPPAKDISQMIAQLHGILEEKEKALKEREDALEKRLKLFDDKYPQTGKESDVLHLNIGGTTNIAVLRRTLTNFGQSMLATQFSGRCDDSLEKDKDGNFFIDEDPALFLQLLNYLRRCEKKKRDDIKFPRPQPTSEFCWMLEYYDLMPVVYPQEWLPAWGGKTAVLTRPGLGDNAFTIQTTNGKDAFTLELDTNRKTKPAMATEFVAVFEQGSTGQIGWAPYECSSRFKVGHDKNSESLALDLESTCFMTDGQMTRSYRDNWTQESSVTIRCSYDILTKTYRIQIEGAPPEYTATKVAENRLTPHISVIGKVTISHVVYAY